MALPQPTHQFTIPSLYDGTLLQCRIYHPDYPQPRDRESTWIQKGAMIAHPYAPLGGCYDDPVVAIVASELLRAGYVVGTFNLRGAGGSQGRTSWTARPELGDFTSFHTFLVYYILDLETLSKPASIPVGEHGSSVDETSCPSIIVSGYSYGSMLASYLPTLRSILLVFKDSKDNDTPARIIHKAQSLSSRWNRELRVQKGLSGPDSPAPCTATAKAKKINISYLLISPILPPISLFAATALLTPTSRLTTAIYGKIPNASDLRDKVLEHQTLAIFGDKDGFTSSRKLTDWCEELKKSERSLFNSVMVKGVGHFWRESGAEPQMRRAIQEWVATKLVYPGVQ